MTPVSFTEYEKARENVGWINKCVQESTERIMVLVEKLTEEKKTRDAYYDLLYDNKKIILAYETQEELRSKAGQDN